MGWAFSRLPRNTSTNAPRCVYSPPRLATFFLSFGHSPFGNLRPIQLNRIVTNPATARQRLSVSARVQAGIQPGRVISSECINQ